MFVYQAVPHAGAWRGSGDKSVWSLLAELWRKEERDMGVPRGVMDTLAGEGDLLYKLQCIQLLLACTNSIYTLACTC